MSWGGIKVNNVLMFCSNWRSREEIAKQFELSPIESWHCVRWLGKLRHDVIVEKRVGLTGRKYMYRTRRFVLDDITEGRKEQQELSKEKIEELSEASEVEFLDGDEIKVKASESDPSTPIPEFGEKVEDSKEPSQEQKVEEPHFDCPYCQSPAVPDPKEPEVLMCSNKDCEGKKKEPSQEQKVEEPATEQSEDKAPKEKNDEFNF